MWPAGPRSEQMPLMHNSSGNALQVYYVVDEAQSPSWRGGVGYVTPQVRKRCVLAQVSVHSSRLGDAHRLLT